MKCANPECNREIGLVAYRRGWFSKRRYCSKHCRYAFVPQKRQQKQGASSYFEWLFATDWVSTAEAEASSHPYKGTLSATYVLVRNVIRSRQINYTRGSMTEGIHRE